MQTTNTPHFTRRNVHYGLPYFMGQHISFALFIEFYSLVLLQIGILYGFGNVLWGTQPNVINVPHNLFSLKQDSSRCVQYLLKLKNCVDLVVVLIIMEPSPYAHFVDQEPNVINVPHNLFSLTLSVTNGCKITTF